MANTYTLIETQSLSTAVASVTFSAIPQTYTDLVLKISARQGAENAFSIQFNGNTGANYSYLMLGGDGGSVSSASDSVISQIISRGINPGSATANTFGNTEIYIPNYTNTSYYKSISADGVNENNATEIYMSLVSGFSSSTSAVTSITITARAGSLVQFSSFYLYGIKNS